MPIYEYECRKCHKNHEISQKHTDAPLTTCPECGGKMKKLISNTSFVLKAPVGTKPIMPRPRRVPRLRREPARHPQIPRKRSRRRSPKLLPGFVSAIHVHIPTQGWGVSPAHYTEETEPRDIFPSSTLDTLETADVKRLRESLNYDPSLSIHAPFMDLSPGAVDEKSGLLPRSVFPRSSVSRKSFHPRSSSFIQGMKSGNTP